MILKHCGKCLPKGGDYVTGSTSTCDHENVIFNYTVDFTPWLNSKDKTTGVITSAHSLIVRLTMRK